MSMLDVLVGPVTKILDKIIPDPAARDAAKLEMLKLQQAGEFREEEVELERLRVASANIVSESTSSDKWTSRARPSFMYVIYVLILMAIPMGILAAFKPMAAVLITEGFKGWLSAIPSDMIALFGVGYVGYAGARSIEKIKGKG